MSTRCHVVLKDEHAEQWFYRHCDGYPDGTLPTLFEFMTWIKDKKIRDNVQQSSGWLIMIGAIEYSDFTSDITQPHKWKVGAYEPCPEGYHSDIQYIYTIDVEKNKLEVYDLSNDRKTTFSYEDLLDMSLNEDFQVIR